MNRRPLLIASTTISCKRWLGALTMIAIAVFDLGQFARAATDEKGIPGLSGRQPGTVKVESSGAATYSIPIIVPPGTAGVAPNLAFVYSSQGGNGLLGMGWSISGLPIIDRCGRTIAQDGAAGGVNFDSNDRFCMDGARLMAVNGAYGASGTEYRTEVDKFIKIVSHGSVAGGSGPLYFTAQTKDGLTMEFGNSPTSARQAEGKTSIRVWALNKLRDTKGNYLTVTYSDPQFNAQGYYRPERIDYTANAAGLNATRSVRFTAEARTDVWPMYVGGSVVKILERITHVTTYVGETPVRDYELQYEYGSATKRSRLKSIKECAGAVCMPAHTFDWQEGGDGTYTSTPYNYPNGNFTTNFVWPGDYNGDGKMDLATIENGRLYTYFSTGSGTYTLPNVYDYPGGKFTAPYVWPGDFDGDGITDLVTSESGKLYTYKSNRDGTYTLLKSDGYNYPNGNFTPGYVWPGDYNGDGRIDLVTNENGRLYTYLSNGDGNYALTPPSGGYNYPNGNFSPGFAWSGDYNGDTMTDIATVENGRLYTYLSNGNGTYTKVPETGFNYPNGNFTANHVWAGDYNADGKIDLATVENGILYTYFSKGDGNYQKAPFDFPNANFEVNYVWVVDYNGDGKTDLASRENGVLYTYFSRGDGNYDRVPFDFINSNFNADKVWPADYKGHGKSDWASATGGVLYTYTSNGAYPDLLVRITNPFQGKNEITYKPLSDSSVYSRETIAQYLGSYPNIDVQIPVYVVSNLTVSDVDNNYPYTYAYVGAKLNLLGRGWLGFRTMDVFDASAQARNITYFKQLFPLTGLTVNQETENAAGAVIVDVEYTYTESDPSFPNPNHGVKRVLLTRMETEEVEGQGAGRRTGKTFSHDSHGNLVLTLHEGVVGVAGDEREEQTDWISDTTKWLFRPKTNILRQGSGAGAVLLREKWLFYDGNNGSHGALGDFGLVTKEESRRDASSGMGSPNNPVFTYTYDAFGNRISATDPRNCTTTTTYETTHRTYPTSVRACSNLSSPNFETTYEYFPEHGGIKKKTDPNLAATRFEYDTFGRPTKIINEIDYQQGSPNGTESYSYPQWGTAGAQRVVITKTEDHGVSGGVVTEHYFDGFGRIDLTSSEGPSGSPILTQMVYDSRGLVTAKSIPRFQSESLRWEQITYDARGRETLVLHADGTSVSKVYASGQVTITDERGKIKIHLLDAYGRLAQVQEKNGSDTYTTNYTYDGAGALKTVTNHLNHVTSMSYDMLGRKTSMQDPNMGTATQDWRYTYTKAGDLESQTDAKNQTICFEYDPLGRITLKKQGQTQNCSATVAILFTWTYDISMLSPQAPLPPDNPLGRLTKIVDGVTLAETRYAYDKLGRTTQTRRTIDGVSYTLSQVYDALNRVKSETFPDNDVISYTYNAAGWLSSVTGYINSISYNARGQRTSLVYANGITSTFTYDDTDSTPSFRMLRRQATLSSGTHNLNALTGWVRSWTTSPGAFVNLYRGGICVADGSGNCVGGDSMLESGVGPAIGYISTVGGFGTIPVYRSTCYSSGATCTGWGLSLTPSGSAVGYLATSPPDSQSATKPFVDSNGLLLQGLSGTASAYLWTTPPQFANHTTHLYLAPGPAPDGYTSEGITGYIDQASSAGTVPLYRFLNSTNGHYYYSTVNDAPSGYSSDGTLGYLHSAGGSGLTALYRHYNSTVGDYRLTTSSTPPSGYQLQATLGYIHTSAGPTGSYQDLTYTYDNGGNILTINDALWTGSREFGYDDLNRLTQATGNFGQNLAEVTHTYAYDAIGNILSKGGVLYYYCNHPLQPAAPQHCMSNVHPSTVAATSDGRSYTYDANGNTLTGAGRTFTWNSDNRLEFLSAPGGSITNVYDHTGTRIKKTGSGGTTYYPFAGYEIDPSNVVTKYIRLGTEMLAAKKGGDKLFYHNDHQGGVNVITNIFAAVVQLNEYDPWGKVSRSEGSNAEPTKRFNGKEFDAESGLYYYGGRYHDPDLARFVSADPFVQEPDNPQNFNRYSYTINNPQKYIDPSGHFFGFIFSLIFDRATAGKLTAASDPFSFLLSKIPRKANGAFNILGGVAMLFTGNPSGVLYIASGAMSFGKGNGFQIAGQVLGIAGAVLGLGESSSTETGLTTGDSYDIAGATTGPPTRDQCVLAGGGCTFNIVDNPNAKSTNPWYRFESLSQVGKYSAEIDKVAQATGVDANLIRSVMYIETTQGWYDAPLQLLGLNKSIRPMNINVEFWGGAFGSRADLLDPLTNIQAGARILKGIQANLPPGSSIAKIGTLYNNLGATKVSNYGATIQDLYRRQPWK